jgi:hypothetical protein
MPTLAAPEDFSPPSHLRQCILAVARSPTEL